MANPPMNSDPGPLLPDEMFRFVLQHVAPSESGARLGELALRQKQRINTPHYIVPSSRGAIPHLSPDNLIRNTRISAVYVPLEDFIEKSATTAPIFSTPIKDGDSRLRQYTGLPDQALSLLGPRRLPSILTPAHNTNSSIAISTSVGFRFLDVKHYDEAVQSLQADISMSLADVITHDVVSAKRMEKSADRTHAWLRDTIEASNQNPKAPLFASIPPLEPEQLSFYLSDIEEDFRPHLSGLAVYNPAIIMGLTDSLRRLPVVCLSDPATPQAVLSAIHTGVDMITVPFVTRASEHGIALCFSFPGSPETPNQPLGIDFWSPDHNTDLSALSPGCSCYACSRHHRAYLAHLLQASEMVAWTLLQIHNFAIIESFFSSIRQSIARGTFEDDIKTFGRAYDSEMPQSTGQGPRIRGYQAKSVGGGEPKRNPRAYGKLDDQVQKLAEAASGIAAPEGDAMDIEEHGLAKRVEE
ncbi:uncharacterized protein A1O9_09244 [Exophiala aquamarina CBS 119918]|uniref:Queuine tRNA-ribosyltransferase accessory subunit 2 n=1 Tax=Exophiala aquamarina CBS 119918 TaxID=1182545 RepID=A0A072P533_9EURO|nr:uncharacterized protein A1O9_09244 [Exophiala aquamarina CBS 119918]KEF54802.1 hypothetical protein A1O9_09244 [Exophiala aquamarina CBS 119918]